MNNDIPSELTKYIRANTGYIPQKGMPSQKDEQGLEGHTSDDYKKTQDYLYTLGLAKVNIDKEAVNKRVEESVKDFKENPEYAQSHVDFCDELVKKGCSLEDAIEKTDYIFDKLKNEATYRP